MKIRGLKTLKLLLLLSFIAMIAFLLATDNYRPDAILHIRDFVQSQKIWGPVVFIVCFALLQPLGVGSHGFILASAIVWPSYLAFVYSLTGVILASMLAFWFARFVGYDCVQERLPSKLKAFEQRLVHKQFRSILIMRLLFFTFAPMQLMFGITRVNFKVYLLATAVGVSPLILLEVIFGAALFDWLIKT